jgi:ADP-heptose:LPS heptosyltransferase
MGDTLLCNSLCQNIKKTFPDSKVVYIVNKPFYEAAKYQKDVDEVIAFDKFGEHKSLLSRLKFILNFPYKHADYAFVTYRNNTNSLIARLIGSKRIIEYNKKQVFVPMQEHFVQLLEKITDKQISYVPMKYEVSDKIPEHLSDIILPNNKYVALCTLTTDTKKDIPIDTADKIIKLLSKNGYKVLLIGTGNNAVFYAETLRQNNCDFISLVNKTSISELGSVLKNCQALISPDTGTMHLGCAVNIPVVCVFYKKESVLQWAPDESLYTVSVITENQTAENIYSRLSKLLSATKL